MDAKTEVIRKMTAFVESRYGGEWDGAFRAFDHDGDGRINGEEMSLLLAAAGVGNRLTRSAWVRGVIVEMDRDHDQCVSWKEFLAAVGE